MQQGLMDLTKGLALQSSSHSGSGSGGVDAVTIEMLIKGSHFSLSPCVSDILVLWYSIAKNELKADYSEQCRQLAANLSEQDKNLKEEIVALQRILESQSTSQVIAEKEAEDTTSIDQGWKEQIHREQEQLVERVRQLEAQLTSIEVKDYHSLWLYWSTV